MIIMVTLTILVVLTLFSFILGSDFVGSIYDSGIEETVLVNGTATEITYTGYDSVFSIDPVLGAIAILIVILVIAVALGIQIVGSGLSSTSIRIIVICIVYFGMWGLLSVLAEPLISSIEVFGTMIYVSLTIGYTIGVIQKISGGGDE